MPKNYEVFDVVDYLETPEDIAEYLSIVIEDGDEKQMLRALGDVVRASNTARIARQAGVSRESLYTSLSREGNPRYTNLVAILKSLGLELMVRTASSH